jgi:alkanesulfonate monooxygenase SsuD/methylene tetrahydromethanopterin reductase-like flavin-dependent oxidoreductase (luciferase family)
VSAVELVANVTSTLYDPREFAAWAEEVGFAGVSCSDHYWLREPFPHLWVTLAAMATATSRVTLSPSFANNLFRSPVEFAQASVAMQRLSGGRYEAGLGAGWTEREMVATGQHFPSGPERARRYREALLVVRELLATGRCRFEGEHYTMDVPPMGVAEVPIPLVASVGGPWTIRHVTPIVDRVELKFGRTTRGGQLDLAAMASVTRAELAEMVAAVQEAKPGIPVGLFLMVAVGDDPAVRTVGDALGGNLCGEFVGEATKVRDRLASLHELGIGRVQVTEYAKGSLHRLGEVLR